jgi:hypothetical protein
MRAVFGSLVAATLAHGAPEMPVEPPPPVFAAPSPANPAAADAGAAAVVDERDCVLQIAALAKRARADAATYHLFARELRGIAIENPGPKHRRTARRALVKLLLLRGGLVQPSAPHGCVAAEGPLAATELTGMQEAYDWADGGVPAAAKLADLLRRSAGDPAVKGLRIVAANSLALTGVIPTPKDIAELDAWLTAAAREKGPAADVLRLELALALAAHAQKAKEAYTALQEHLLRDPCPFPATLAFELPSEDLRYSLFRKLRDDQRPRAQAVRKWVRSQRLPSCS